QLADYAKANLEKTGYVNVEVIHHEGSRGYDNKAPYDRIIVTAAAPKIPGELTQQLADDGLMLIPVGSKFMQTLLSLHKKKDKIVEKEICGCVFVPLIGEEGW
ncbi:MAG: protein-L-isoaspartate O-methyltransferase, partial [Candidatus Altiarchaeales archaeon ex4484_96]